MNIREALAKANQKLSAKIDDALTKEVFEAIRDTEIESIMDIVYRTYSPLQYRRRGDFEGLADPYNIEVKGKSAVDGKLVVVNTTEANTRTDGSTNKTLPELIEYGHSRYVRLYGVGYDYISSVKWRREKYMAPRPFTAKTIERLDESKDHIQALKSGLKRQGVKVK